MFLSEEVTVTQRSEGFDGPPSGKDGVMGVWGWEPRSTERDAWVKALEEEGSRSLCSKETVWPKPGG